MSLSITTNKSGSIENADIFSIQMNYKDGVLIEFIGQYQFIHESNVSQGQVIVVKTTEENLEDVRDSIKAAITALWT